MPGSGTCSTANGRRCESRRRTDSITHPEPYMRLICLNAEAVRALTNLHVPFDDLTPTGLWGSDLHLIGVGPEQRDVLARWGIELQDVTPRAFEGAAEAAADRLAYPDTALRDG